MIELKLNNPRIGTYVFFLIRLEYLNLFNFRKVFESMRQKCNRCKRLHGGRSAKGHYSDDPRHRGVGSAAHRSLPAEGISSGVQEQSGTFLMHPYIF